MITLRESNLLFRFLAILLGTSLLLWLSIEDTSETIPILFAYLISSYLVAALLQRNKNRAPFPFFYIILAGILVGVLIILFSLFLIAFKTGLHAHPVPEFTYEQITSIIRRTPTWLISGFFIGIGIGIMINSQEIHQESNLAI